MDTKTPIAPGYLTTAQGATLTGWSQKQFTRFRDRGEFAYIKKGGSYRYATEDLHEWMRRDRHEQVNFDDLAA